MDIQLIIQKVLANLPGILTAIVFHEVAHGYISYKFGDPTAKNQGRLTLNPIPHADIVGTVLLPAICLFVGGVFIGWAKPVPIDSRYYKNPKKGLFWVAFAGPLANYLTAVVAMLVIFCLSKFTPGFFLTRELIAIFSGIMQFNFFIGTFNLIPIPPLDGSRMVSVFLNYDAQIKYNQLERYGFFIILLLWQLRVLNYFYIPFMYVFELISSKLFSFV